MTCARSLRVAGALPVLPWKDHLTNCIKFRSFYNFFCLCARSTEFFAQVDFASSKGVLEAVGGGCGREFVRPTK